MKCRPELHGRDGRTIRILHGEFRSVRLLRVAPGKSSCPGENIDILSSLPSLVFNTPDALYLEVSELRQLSISSQF